ncbi:hypothetical protein Aeqsu_0146 [Aequorivita sublithincola DSM 14238]|uniref:Lipoprotein n=1 Tax=Aequorivita sublithincola (strain DSM 14238 / LMG 21431 / ACAM 643 / 9-3) TaxID=746697 RepID=I3YRQ6_AEQSU|nr:hypothetical protein [Aequorivita sublithincola]AFL79674.1 hypothetical protein Aeqsu_0146 [Aequorivita sublithincola DSM 14238]
MRKAILYTALISAITIGCNDANKQEQSETVEATEVIQENNSEEIHTEDHSLNNDWVNEIALDNGAKWEANLETNEGVLKMLEDIKSSEPQSIEDYHGLATQLNEEKNTVVKQCTMKGPSHDNLHVFLHPLIEKIGALGKVSTTTEGAEITKSIKENLDAYSNYFK